MRSNLIICKDRDSVATTAPDQEVVSVSTIKGWIQSGRFLSHIFRYPEATYLTSSFTSHLSPLATVLLTRLLTFGKAFLKDNQGQRVRISAPMILRLAFDYAKQFIQIPLVLKHHKKKTKEIQLLIDQKSNPPILAAHKSPLYLFTDHLFGVSSGGFATHTTGVLNNLSSFFPNPLFITSTEFQNKIQSSQIVRINHSGNFREFKDIYFLDFNPQLKEKAFPILKKNNLSFIYQRYSLNNYSGLEWALKLSLPFILEFNGPEVWVHRNWSKPLRHEKLAQEIETLNLQGADVITVVSQPLKDQLISNGIHADKILVNPNGVDPEMFNPQIEGNNIRKKHNIDDHIVIGFIGTFGKWHGAEVLAKAFGHLLSLYPELKNSVRLLMIGRGTTLTQVKKVLTDYSAQDETIFTGSIPQNESPGYLAACDILVSPHIPNADGTPFFGSPTKLFEYMAMGKGIIASNLNQIGEVIEHRKTGLLVPPGDREALASALKLLIDEPELTINMGKNARNEVVSKYTWKEHTRRIVEKLKERCPCR